MVPWGNIMNAYLEFGAYEAKTKLDALLDEVDNQNLIS